MSSLVSRGPLRAVLLTALGLPACGAPSSVEAPAAEGAPGGARVAADGVVAGGGTERKLGRVCVEVSGSASAEVRCSEREVEVHRDSLAPCGDPSSCAAPEVCASTPEGSAQLACRLVPRSGASCESSHDCPAGESCLAAAGGPARCVSDACGMGCPEAQQCAIVVDRYTREADATMPVARDASSDGPPSLGCFPVGAKTHARPYVNRSPCDRQGSDTCNFVGGRWVCERWVSMRPCGRPVLVDGAPVVARGVAAEAWARSAEVPSSDATPELAARFRRIAFDEHASIAAFARSVAMLSALGAPASLLASTSRALSDEVEHAREAFALAARFGGAPEGPGAFPEAVAPFGPSDAIAESLLFDVIVGGCVGETLAVAEAEAWLASAPPEARPFLERVIVDEARHAALAFATARWLLERDPSLAATAERAIDEAIRRFELGDDTQDALAVALRAA